MAFVPPLEPSSDRSPLAAARLRRQLTLEDAAKQAKLTPEEVSWLETGRLYRFPSSESATLALLLYATSLEIDRREARELAGLPVPPQAARPQPGPPDRHARRRARRSSSRSVPPSPSSRARPPSDAQADAARAEKLPPTWKVSVDVLNGSGNIVYTRRVADRITSLAYTVRSVRRADRFDYPGDRRLLRAGRRPRWPSGSRTSSA